MRSQPNRSKSDTNLYHNLEKIGTQFRTLNFDRELQFQHLQKLIQHIDIGIIAFDNHDKIHLVNKSFQDLFKLPFIAKNQPLNKLSPEFEAISNTINPRIDITTSILPNPQFCLQIRDNGKGISEEKLGKVFIPFYTDKEEGSGIGLSLCKQIMKLHSGKISIESKENEFTAINLFFKLALNK